MSHAISTESQPKAHQAAVAAIAQETATSIDLVKALYEEELASLSSTARVKQFVGVIATRRVKQTLRSLDARGH